MCSARSRMHVRIFNNVKLPFATELESGNRRVLWKFRVEIDLYTFITTTRSQALNSAQGRKSSIWGNVPTNVYALFPAHPALFPSGWLRELRSQRGICMVLSFLFNGRYATRLSGYSHYIPWICNAPVLRYLCACPLIFRGDPNMLVHAEPIFEKMEVDLSKARIWRTLAPCGWRTLNSSTLHDATGSRWFSAQIFGRTFSLERKFSACVIYSCARVILIWKFHCACHKFED